MTSSVTTTTTRVAPVVPVTDERTDGTVIIGARAVEPTTAAVAEVKVENDTNDEEGKPLITPMTEDFKRSQTLTRSAQAQNRVLMTLYVVLFLDFMGNFLMMSNSLYLFFPLHDGIPQEDRDRGVGVFYHDAEELGLGQASAQQLGATVSTAAQAFAAFFSGYLTRCVGRKGALICYTFGASVFYALTYFSKDWGLLPYYGLRICTGLLAGSQPVVNQYIYAMFPDPLVAQKKAAGMAGIIALAVAAGPQIGAALGMSNLFLPFLAGAVLEVLAGLLVIFVVPSPPKQKAEPGDLKTAKSTGSTVPFEQRNYKWWVAVLWSARILDRLGGNQLTHLTRFGSRSFKGVLYDNFAMVFLGYSVLIFFVIPFSIISSKKLGLALMPALTQLLCSIFTVALSVAFTKSDSLALYLTLFYAQAFFNMCGMMVVTPSVATLVPADVKDLWLGYQSALQSGSMALCPMIMVPLADNEKCSNCQPSSDGSIGEGTFLFVTAAFGFLSVIPYIILAQKLPAPKAKVGPSPEEEEEEAAVQAYTETGDPEHLRWMSFKTRAMLQRARLQAGKVTLQVPWRTFKEDKSDLDKLMKIGRTDMQGMIDLWDEELYQIEYGDEKIREEKRQIRLNHFKDGRAKWTQEDKDQLGNWLGDYMQYAGWMPARVFPRFFKAMFMTSFPVLVPGGLKEGEEHTGTQEYIENPVPMMRFMQRVIGGVIDLDKTTSKQNEAASRFNILSFKASQLM